jgi:hypothetical protein
MMCDHSGTYSGASRYLRDAGELRLVLLCDQCGAEREEVGRVKYRPEVRLPRLEGGGLAPGSGPALGSTDAVALP